MLSVICYALSFVLPSVPLCDAKTRPPLVSASGVLVVWVFFLLLSSQSGLRAAYERSLSPTRDPRTLSGEGGPPTRRALGRPLPLADARGAQAAPQLPAYQQQRRPSASDASLVSSGAAPHSPGPKEPESSATKPKKPRQGFWSWLGGR